MTQPSLWSNCLTRLEQELSAQQFNTWIRPLQAVKDDHTLRLLAPNRFVMDWVKERFLTRIAELATQTDTSPRLDVSVEVGGEERTRVESKSPQPIRAAPRATPVVSRLNSEFSFQNHVEGKSNQLARAAARQVGENPGGNNNPLFIYGGVGLGKTHLMQAAGQLILQGNPDAKVNYAHSELFVNDMVKAISNNTMNEFKRHYRSLVAEESDTTFSSGRVHMPIRLIPAQS